jgi:hypothetical protein
MLCWELPRLVGGTFRGLWLTLHKGRNTLLLCPKAPGRQQCPSVREGTRPFLMMLTGDPHGGGGSVTVQSSGEQWSLVAPLSSQQNSWGRPGWGKSN